MSAETEKRKINKQAYDHDRYYSNVDLMREKRRDYYARNKEILKQKRLEKNGGEKKRGRPLLPRENEQPAEQVSTT